MPFPTVGTLPWTEIFYVFNTNTNTNHSKMMTGSKKTSSFWYWCSQLINIHMLFPYLMLHHNTMPLFPQFVCRIFHQFMSFFYCLLWFFFCHFYYLTLFQIHIWSVNQLWGLPSRSAILEIPKYRRSSWEDYAISWRWYHPLVRLLVFMALGWEVHYGFWRLCLWALILSSVHL